MCVGGQEQQEIVGCFLDDDLRAFFGINVDQSVDDCSPGRGGMVVQNGGTRSGTFFMAKWIAACRENQGWTTACSRVPERDRKEGQGEDSPKQAGSCWFARAC